MTPHTLERAAFKKDSCPDTRPVMEREPLDIEDQPFGVFHLSGVLRSGDDVVLHLPVEQAELLAETRNTHAKVLVCFRIILCSLESFRIYNIEL